VIGSMADLDAATVDDVASFFRTYYAPNNAILTIVGDVDTRTTLEKVRQAFESIPSQPPPPKVDAVEPKQTAERRLTIDDALARLPRLDMAYHRPGMDSPDDEALSVLATVLSSGRSSRFYQAIVREKQLAPNVMASAGSSRGPGLFRVTGLAAPGKTLEALEAAIDVEIEKVKSGPIADWEIEKARNNAKRAFVGGLTSSLQRAIQLGDFALVFDDPGRINTRIDRIAKVTAADVQRVAREYLNKEGRSVVLTVPKPPATKGGL